MEMEILCRICLQKYGNEFSSLRKEINAKSLAELMEFLSGVEVC